MWAVLAAGVVVVVCAVLWGHASPSSTPIVCTLEAKQCPDGSWAGRSGPACEFVCPGGPVSAGSTTTPGTGEGFAEYHSGVRGTVVAGPACPVARPDAECADQPYATTVAVFRANDPVHPLALVRSGADGTFEVSLPPGEYVVGAGESELPRCLHVAATVGPAGYTPITVSCDTGIR